MTKHWRIQVELREFRDSLPIKYWHTTLADSEFEAVENVKERHNKAYSVKVLGVF